MDFGDNPCGGVMMWSVDTIISVAGLVLSLISLLITAYVGVWIADELQKRSESSKAMREYMVANIIKEHDSIRLLFIAMYNGELSTKVMKARANLYFQQLSNLLLITKNRYKIEGIDLKKIITQFYLTLENSKSFREHYLDNEFVNFPENELKSFRDLETQIEVQFHKLINDIYEARESN